MKLLSHPNIATIHDAFEDDKRMYIITDKCVKGNPLLEEMASRKNLTEKDVAMLAKSMLTVLDYLHSKGLAHKSLRPESILLGAGEPFDKIIITDFEGGYPVGSKTSKLVPPFYLAPEALKGDAGPQSDMWSVGVIIYVLLSGGPPATDDKSTDVFHKIRQGQFELSSPVWFSVSKTAKQFVIQCLKKDAKYRLTPKKAMEHEWIK